MALLAADLWLAQGIINTSIVAALLSETEALSNWTFCNEQESVPRKAVRYVAAVGGNI